MEFVTIYFECNSKLRNITPISIVYAVCISSEFIFQKMAPFEIKNASAQISSFIKITHRSISAKYCIQVWGDASSYDELRKQIWWVTQKCFTVGTTSLEHILNIFWPPWTTDTELIHYLNITKPFQITTLSRGLWEYSSLYSCLNIEY